jgi:hypothetical protein
MTVMPILSGGLKLSPEDDLDWQVLNAIVADADPELAERLGGLMDEESMWDDIVVPDLQKLFSGQLETVATAVKKGRAAEEIIISKEECDAWYSALNQARLGIEKKYHFGQNDELEESEIQDKKIRSAYLRGRFYCAVQSLLIEFVMEC